MKIKHVRPFATGLLCCVLTAGVLLLAVIGLTVYIVIQKKNNKHNA